MSYPVLQITEADRSLANHIAQIRLGAARKYGKRHLFKTDHCNLKGCLGEVLFGRYFDLDPDFEEYAGSDNYDFVMLGCTIDVKAISRNVDPQPHYVAEMAKKHFSKPVHYFCFLSINQKSERCFFVGFLSRAEFQQKAVFVAKGTMRKGWKCLHNKYEVPIADLHPIEELKTTLRARVVSFSLP